MLSWCSTVEGDDEVDLSLSWTPGGVAQALPSCSCQEEHGAEHPLL